MVYKLGISSHSLGRAWVHTLDVKLSTAAAHGYLGLELFYEDLESLARSLPGGLSSSNLLAAAHHVRALCDSRGLEIWSLQPFMHYEGLTDRQAHGRKIETMRLWIELCGVLGTDIIGVPSNFQATGTTGDMDLIVADLREIADLGARATPKIRFAYEALCWGTYVQTWEDSWEVVRAVDRDNFGLCLDTFNIAGREWADPSAPSGKLADAGERLQTSLKRMVAAVDPKRVFFVQLVDAERLRVPLTTEHQFHVQGQPARMSWSRNARLFPFEESRGGYLPVLDVLKAICDPPESDEGGARKGGLGYEGNVSFELFSRSMADPRAEVPGEHAARGCRSWEKVVGAMGWEGRAVGGVKKNPEAIQASGVVTGKEVKGQVPASCAVQAQVVGAEGSLVARI
jgi:4-hydroxyphenylpyruvate dioxygenase